MEVPGCSCTRDVVAMAVVVVAVVVAALAVVAAVPALAADACRRNRTGESSMAAVQASPGARWRWRGDWVADDEYSDELSAA